MRWVEGQRELKIKRRMGDKRKCAKGGAENDPSWIMPVVTRIIQIYNM
jgi:hypothetical protein